MEKTLVCVWVRDMKSKWLIFFSLSCSLPRFPFVFLNCSLTLLQLSADCDLCFCTLSLENCFQFYNPHETNKKAHFGQFGQTLVCCIPRHTGCIAGLSPSYSAQYMQCTSILQYLKGKMKIYRVIKMLFIGHVTAGGDMWWSLLYLLIEIFLRMLIFENMAVVPVPNLVVYCHEWAPIITSVEFMQAMQKSQH